MSNLNDVLHIKNQTIKSKNKEINALRVKVKELTRALAEEVSPPPFGKSCCEEAALNAAEVDRLTRERYLVRKRNADEFDSWLAEHDRKVRAAAWDEGFMAVRNREHHKNMTDEQSAEVWPNPYREQP